MCSDAVSSKVDKLRVRIDDPTRAVEAGPRRVAQQAIPLPVRVPDLRRLRGRPATLAARRHAGDLPVRAARRAEGPAVGGRRDRSRARHHPHSSRLGSPGAQGDVHEVGPREALQHRAGAAPIAPRALEPRASNWADPGPRQRAGDGVRSPPLAGQGWRAPRGATRDDRHHEEALVARPTGNGADLDGGPRGRATEDHAARRPHELPDDADLRAHRGSDPGRLRLAVPSRPRGAVRSSGPVQRGASTRSYGGPTGT